MLNLIDPSSLTPMMKQYYDIKKSFRDSIVLFRMGDFYEMFFDDAITASKELEIVLTSRDCGLEEKAPMAGIPHHTSEPYINKLVSRGYRVAICEQLENPNEAQGLVKRGVVRVISPGMNLESENHRSYNYLMSLYVSERTLGISYIDISTGDISFSEESLTHQTLIHAIQNQLAKIKPKEILINRLDNKEVSDYLNQIKSIFISYYDLDLMSPDRINKNLCSYVGKKSLKGLRGYNFALVSLNALLDYVYSFEKSDLRHFKDPVYVDNNKYMYLDSQARYNLDISRNKNHDKSLVDLLDRAVTPMGSRLIETSVENPLRSLDEIKSRQAYVEVFYEDPNICRSCRDLLENIYDIERILGKLSYSRANARDLKALENSLEVLPKLKSLLSSHDSEIIGHLGDNMDTLEDIYELIGSSIVDDPPIAITDGGIIKQGFNKELDSIRTTSIEGERRLESYEDEQREETGIKNLKIVFNKNTGYFLDITKSNLDKVPESYHKVQTLTNSERFITAELKEIENMIFTSSDDTKNLEYTLFNIIRENITSRATRIQSLCELIASLDMASSLGKVAYENSYIKPEFTLSKDLIIENGRHPMIEGVIGKLEFIPNDTSFTNTKLIQIITGPNMSGKSTYLRQTALIIIMAQIGSFVPADKARLPIIDKIFTRIGASDNIIHGDSTFMVEMKEMANIINNASSNSLLLLDEVGRGTSTYDGLSIAWAILEYISTSVKAKTLFATHYQELISLSDRFKNIKNYSIKVDEDKNGIIFLYKIEEGSVSKSFGIEVAKLAGLPNDVIERARVVLDSIEATSSFKFNQDKLDKQIDFTSLQKDSFLKNLSDIDINTLSPLDAFNQLKTLIDNAKLLGD